MLHPFQRKARPGLPNACQHLGRSPCLESLSYMRSNAVKPVKKFYPLTWVLAMLSHIRNLPDNYGFLTDFSHVVSKAVDIPRWIP